MPRVVANQNQSDVDQIVRWFDVLHSRLMHNLHTALANTIYFAISPPRRMDSEMDVCQQNRQFSAKVRQK